MGMLDLRKKMSNISWKWITGITIVALLMFYYFSFDIYIGIGTAMMVFSFFSYFKLAKDDVFNPLAIVTVFWIGVAGLANYRLSTDQYEWGIYTFFIVFIAYIMFVIGYLFLNKSNINIKDKEVNVKRLYIGINIIVALSIIAFLLEAYVLKMIPLFSSNMDAYQTFHISGVHYFVVNIGIVPALTISYKACGGKRSIWHLNVISFLIPLFIVSRQLLLFATIVALVNYNISYKKVNILSTLAVALVIVVSFSILLNLRHQDVAYIDNVSNIVKSEQVKVEDNKSEVEQEKEINEKREIFIYNITEKPVFKKLIQPYMYLTMNFENLRNITENFHDYKYGENMIFPVLAFTNTKKYVNYDYKMDYLTNVNFNTNTGLADVYFDFGAIGVIILSVILGAFFGFYNKYSLNKDVNKVLNVFYSTAIYCLIFCFFVSWYNNPTIWFHLISIILVYMYCTRKKTSL